MAKATGKPEGAGDVPQARREMGLLPVASLVSSVTRPLMRGKQAAVARLALDWPAVVGPALAAVTAPERLVGGAEGGTLTIRASGPVALELTHLAPELIARINGHLGRGAVAQLRFTERRRQRGEGLPTPPPRPLPRPPPREAVAKAAATVADLPDGPLKDALARLGAHLVARR
ncbi:DUF721 domain-containing protein [Elioraea sp.]|uniref:DUF721 domain-containing protein n=1 Tax=Elioraea sp. TaxID=2185103 RepID=UPI0025BD4C3F|nr:DUF721 domain-containing protein [Elioraea sp.]